MQKTSPEKVKEIVVSSTGLTPAIFTTKIGQQVTWANDSGKTVKVEWSRSGPEGSIPPPDSGEISDGGEWNYTFSAPGHYAYSVSGKSGRVVVEA